MSTTDRRDARPGRLVVIDNYDSFTWNIVQYLRELGARVEVVRNDTISLDELHAMRPEALLLSPGPGNPDSAGITLDVLERLGPELPMLGVCLGHQCLGQRFGGRIVHAGQIMHGKVSQVHHHGIGVFEGVPSPLTATRYHSLVIERASLPSSLEITAWTLDERGEMEEIMGVRHRQQPLEGVQFHPESISSDHGHRLFENFLRRVPGLLVTQPVSARQETPA